MLAREWAIGDRMRGNRGSVMSEPARLFADGHEEKSGARILIQHPGEQGRANRLNCLPSNTRRFQFFTENG